MTRKSIFGRYIIFLLAIFFEVLGVGPSEISWITKYLPLFNVMSVFYFAVLHRVFPIWFVFILGIWSDALGFNVIGLTAICYILISRFFLVANKRMFLNENFLQIWYQFCSFCAVFLLSKWVLLSVFNAKSYSFKLVFTQFILTCLFYVPMHKFFDFISSKFLRKELK